MAGDPRHCQDWSVAVSVDQPASSLHQLGPRRALRQHRGELLRTTQQGRHLGGLHVQDTQLHLRLRAAGEHLASHL